MKSKEINKVPNSYISGLANYQQNNSSVEATRIPQENREAGKFHVSDDDESVILNTDDNIHCSTSKAMNSSEDTQDKYLQEQAYDIASIKAEIIKTIRILENQRYPCHRDVSINSFSNYECLETKPEEKNSRFHIMNKDAEDPIYVFQQELVSSTSRDLSTSKQTRHEFGCQVNNEDDGSWAKNEHLHSKNDINHQMTYSKENVATQKHCRDSITEPNSKHKVFKLLSKFITEPMFKQKPTLAACSCPTWRKTLQHVDSTCQYGMYQTESRTMAEKNSCLCPLKSNISVNALCSCPVARSTECHITAHIANKSTGVKTRPKNQILHKFKKKCLMDNGTKIEKRCFADKEALTSEDKYTKNNKVEASTQCIQNKNNISKGTEVPEKTSKSTEMVKNVTKFVENEGTIISKRSVINVTTKKFEESPKLVTKKKKNNQTPVEKNGVVHSKFDKSTPKLEIKQKTIKEKQLRNVTTQTNENKSYDKNVQVHVPESPEIQQKGFDKNDQAHVPLQLKPTITSKARAKLKYQNLPKNKCQNYPKCLELRKSKSSFYWKLSRYTSPKCLELRKSKSSFYWKLSRYPKHKGDGLKKKNYSGASSKSKMYCSEHVETKHSQKKFKPIRQKCLIFNFNQYSNKYKKISWKKYFNSLLYTPKEKTAHITRKYRSNESILESLNLKPGRKSQCNIAIPYKKCNKLCQDDLQFDEFRHYHAPKLGSKIVLPQKVSKTKLSQCLKSQHKQNNAMSQHNSHKRVNTKNKVKKDITKVKSTTTKISTESKNSDRYITKSLRTTKTTENIILHRNMKRENEACTKMPCLKFPIGDEIYCKTLGNINPDIPLSAKQKLSPVTGGRKMYFPTYRNAGDCYNLEDINSNQAKYEKASKFQIVTSSSKKQILPRMSKTSENINYQKTSSWSSISRKSKFYHQNKTTRTTLHYLAKTQSHNISENYTSAKESFRSKLEKYFSPWNFFSKSIQTSTPTGESGKKFKSKENKRVNLIKSCKKQTYQDNKTEESLKRVNKYGNRKQHNGLIFNYRKPENIITALPVNNETSWNSSKRVAHTDNETIWNPKERSSVTILFTKDENDFDQFDSGPSDLSLKKPIDTSCETILANNTYQSYAPINSKCSKESNNLQIWSSKSNNTTLTQIPQKSASLDQNLFDNTVDFNSYLTQPNNKRKNNKKSEISFHSCDESRLSGTLDYISHKNKTELKKDLKCTDNNPSKMEVDSKSTEITKNRKTSWIFHSGELFKRIIQRCISKQKITIPLNYSQDVKITIHTRKKDKNTRECGKSRHEINGKKQSDLKMDRKSVKTISNNSSKLFWKNNQNSSATSKSCSNYMNETKNKRNQKSLTKPEYLRKSQEYYKRYHQNNKRRDKTFSQCDMLTKCKRKQVQYNTHVRTKDDIIMCNHVEINNRNHSATKQSNLQTQRIKIPKDTLRYRGLKFHQINNKNVNQLMYLNQSEVNKVNCSPIEKHNNITMCPEEHIIVPSRYKEIDKQTSDKTIQYIMANIPKIIFDGKNNSLKQPEIRFEIKKKVQPNCVTFRKKRKPCSKLQLTSDNKEFYGPCKIKQRSCGPFKNRPKLVYDGNKENCKHVKPCKICKSKIKSNCKQAFKICSHVKPCKYCKNKIELEYNNIFKSCSTEDIILKCKAIPKICTHSKPCKTCKRKMEFECMKACGTCATKSACKSCRKEQSSKCKQVLSKIEQCVNRNRNIFSGCSPAPIVCTNVYPCILSNRNTLITPKLSYSCQRKNNKASNKDISLRKLFDPCESNRSCKACKPKRTCKQRKPCKQCKKRSCKLDNSCKLIKNQKSCKSCRYKSCQPSGCCEFHKLMCEPYLHQSDYWNHACRFCFCGLTFLLWMPFFICFEILRHMFCSCMK